jgi:hypothetical protein
MRAFLRVRPKKDRFLLDIVLVQISAAPAVIIADPTNNRTVALLMASLKQFVCHRPCQKLRINFWGSIGIQPAYYKIAKLAAEVG